MYQAFVCKLQNVRPHSNADRIKLGTVFGSQVVIGLDNTEGELGVYFPTDGQLSTEFCANNNLFRHSDLNLDKNKSGYFEDSRRIKTQKFRGEESDGFWMPIECLDFLRDPTIKDGRISEGSGFDTIAGVKICQKYITKKTLKQQSQVDKKTLKKNEYPFFKQHIETKQLAYFTKEIPSGGYCILTEKLHGTSGRTSHTIIPQKPFLWLFDRPDKYKYVSGSRRVIMNFGRSANKDYYGTNLFRKEIHDILKGLLQKGENIFYEIVGWVNKDRLIMQRVQNKKLKDKNFVKRYGDETIFSYGCNPGQYEIYVYRMTMTNHDGYVVEYPWELVKQRCFLLGLKHVPELHTFMFHKMHKDDRDNTAEIMSKVNAYISSASELAAPSTLDNGHIMEGVVLRIETGGAFSAYKHKSFQFKVLEGIIKDSNVVDMEEGS